LHDTLISFRILAHGVLSLGYNLSALIMVEHSALTIAGCLTQFTINCITSRQALAFASLTHEHLLSRCHADNRARSLTSLTTTHALASLESTQKIGMSVYLTHWCGIGSQPFAL
jgi:hypothetical protein